MRAKPPFAAFWFDCDSTLSSIEGIDVLSGRVSKQLLEDVRRLTHQAMEGELPLAEVYEQRLAAIAPSNDDLRAAGQSYIQNLVPDARQTLAALMFLHKTVGIISGGLRQPVLMLARHLGVPEEQVFAVQVLLDQAGNYALSFFLFESARSVSRESKGHATAPAADICTNYRMR